MNLEDCMQWKVIFEESPIGIAVVDREGNFKKVNQKLCSITGYSEYELLKLSYKDITHIADLNADIEMVNKCISDQLDGYVMSKRYITKTNKIVWIKLTVAVIKTDNKFDHFLVHVEPIDVTNGSFKHALETLSISSSENSILNKKTISDFIINNFRAIIVILCSLVSGAVGFGTLINSTINKIKVYEETQEEMQKIILDLQKKNNITE